MQWMNRMVWVLMIVMMAGTVLAGETETAQEPAGSPSPALQAPQPDEAQGQALTAEESQALQQNADSLAGTGQVQEMQVGAGINGTVVLSVLVALVIFAVLIAVL